MAVREMSPAEAIHNGAPRVIHNDEQLEHYTETLVQLDLLENPSPDEQEAIELLALLIDRYESARYPIPNAGPTQVLQFLMESNDLSQKDLITEFGAASTVSAVISGKRQMNRDHIERLSARFHVSPSVFFARM